MRILSAALLLFLTAQLQAAEPLRIAVASNFKPTLEALLPLWQVHSDTSVVLSSGPSGALTQQILAGAPFGLFLSADADYPQALHANAKSAKPVVYARGQLVAACAFAASSGAQALTQAHTLALANARTAPYGRAATRWLQQYGKSMTAKQVQAGSVAGALQFVATGNAECALVASSFQTLAPELHWYSLDHAPVLTQAASVLDTTGAAPEFLRFLLSAEAQHLIQQNGYLAATP
ncbi:molybdate ABC transporter substrate-binding protein [Gilvimarinus agarilyticus]|uniref:molybdate ABC transporter substrate-binding protein n=1 Tax=Gilvimarinus agarilyticus TaxID=679259 RepID=UPI0005A15E1B|nr:molybdate ABC transporter substrate-binding protein [Gilvimarinus agarilyticus]